jgi:nitrogen fixation/metabolism regulation signal transduction histidine kinase
MGGVLLVESGASVLMYVAALAVFALVWLIAAGAFVEQIIRPMQTLANVVAALREDDFSFRARGARRGDALGDLALEINALAGTLQGQRSSALEALTLVERVMTSMQSPVLAFDAQDRLRLHNAAADRAFGLTRQASDGRTAVELKLDPLLLVADEETYSDAGRIPNARTSALRYVVRRTTFRLRGVPHVLLVLSDVGAALREEERLAWQRLIRVLGHEINNSLTPIKSIAGSLRGRLPETSTQTQDLNRDLNRGLAVIEDRAASLNRFLQAYQQLSSLPAPRLEPVQLRPLLERVVHLEQRIEVQVAPGPELTVLADPDQLQQALINLVQNAVDAALEAASNEDRMVDASEHEEPSVQVGWSGYSNRASKQPMPTEAIIRISDNGLGLMNPVNLFVPFYTTKPNGTGIGLALAQQIVIAHKGSLTLTNRSDGAGCVAEMRLPAISRG